MAFINLTKCVHGTLLFYWIITMAVGSPIGSDLYSEYEWHADSGDQSAEYDHSSYEATAAWNGHSSNNVSRGENEDELARPTASVAMIAPSTTSAPVPVYPNTGSALAPQSHSKEEDEDDFIVDGMAALAPSSSPGLMGSDQDSYSYYNLGNGTVAGPPGGDGVEHEGMTEWSFDLLATTNTTEPTTTTPPTELRTSTPPPELTTTTPQTELTAATAPTTTIAPQKITTTPPATPTTARAVAPSFLGKPNPEFWAFLGCIQKEIARRRNEKTGLTFGSISQPPQHPTHHFRRIFLVPESQPSEPLFNFFQPPQEQRSMFQTPIFPVSRTGYNYGKVRPFEFWSSLIPTDRSYGSIGSDHDFFHNFPNLPSVV